MIPLNRVGKDGLFVKRQPPVAPAKPLSSVTKSTVVAKAPTITTKKQIATPPVPKAASQTSSDSNNSKVTSSSSLTGKVWNGSQVLFTIWPLEGN